MARAYLVANYRKGWRGDANRHRLAALGVSTGKSSRRRSTPLNVQLAIMEAAREKEMRDIGRDVESSSLLPFQQQEAQVISGMQASQPEALQIGPLQEVEVPQEAPAVVEEQAATVASAAESSIPGMNLGASVVTPRQDEAEPVVQLESRSAVATPASPPLYAARKRFR
jgi:hypothetical protein